MFSGWATGEVAKNFVKKGGCAVSLNQIILKQEWKNQKQDRIKMFHMFDVPPHTVAGWNMLTTSPYLDIFVNRFTLMEQAGIMARLQRQYKAFKLMEPEVLEPLKLEHFYITLIGNIIGIFVALVAFVWERIIHAKQNHP